jgi:hypothetical protein
MDITKTLSNSRNFFEKARKKVNMKTVKELNEKWWYRLLKVVVGFLLSLTVIGICTAIFFEFEPQFSNEESYIKCENGKEFILSKNGITLFSDYMYSYDTQKARELCRNAPIQMTREEYKLKFGEEPVIEERTAEDTTSRKGLSLAEIKGEKINFEKYRIPQFTLVSVYTDRNWYAIITFSLLTLLGTLLFLEVSRRIFYYIVLGKLKPPKD